MANRILGGNFHSVFSLLKLKITDEIMGNKITYDPSTDIGKNLFYFGEFERKELELCQKYISQDNIIIDVGANIGLHSIYFSALVDKGYVISLEPSLETFELLIKNIGEKQNILSMNLAISDLGGVSDFFYANDNAYSSLIDTRRKKIDKVVKVLCMKLDDVVSGLKLQRIDFVKIDVEGLEYNVLKGMQQIIKNHHPVILCEIYKGSDSNPMPEETVNFLIHRNYKAFVLQDGELIEYYKHNDCYYNYLFLPHEVAKK